MKQNLPKLLRITTVPQSLRILLRGQHRYISENGIEVIGISSSGPVLDEVEKEEGVRTISLEMTRKITPVQDLKSLTQLVRLMRKEKPDIVHTHTPKAGTLGMMAAWMAGVPNRLHTVAGLPLMEATGSKRKLLNFVEKLTYKLATKVYPNSKGLYDFILAEKLTTSEKLKMIGRGSSNGIDTEYFNPMLFSSTRNILRDDLEIPHNSFLYVFVGRLVGDKGINELIDAFGKLEINEIRTQKLLLVGSLESELDPLKPETLNAIKNNQNIISVGYQIDVRPYFTIADALVFPSYREGFPNVVMQAGAMELPSIVSDINGCNEIVIPEVNGLIIPPKNTKALKEAMQQLFADKDLYRNLKSNSRAQIVNRFQQQQIWEALLKEYQSLLQTKN